MSGEKHPWSTTAAVVLLLLMAVLMFTSAWNDCIAVDEAPHIGAGYSYLRKEDYRMNPEHPPLMKDLGGAPLLFMKLHPPWGDKTWADVWGQWDFADLVIFGNNADTITRAAKAPLILFTVLFGWVLFSWTRKHFSDSAALLALFFYVFSPTFLAHGRLVTTDVGAAAGYFVGTVGFLRFLRDPSRRNVVLAGLALGFALLTKFSTIVLLGVLPVLALVWVLVQDDSTDRPRALLRYLALTAGVMVVAALVVYVIYFHHTLKYPPERQRADAEFRLTFNQAPEIPKRIAVWSSDKRALRPWAEYLTGLLMTYVRPGQGGGPYLLGTFYTSGVPFYFPYVYLVKEPLPLHILTVLVLLFTLARIRLSRFRRDWLREHITEFSFLLVIGVYWWAAIRSAMNVGVRHVLPSFPFIYVLVAVGIVFICRRLAVRRAAVRAFTVILGALLVWQSASVLRVHPSYLAYFNELAGGPDGGWQVVTDSNNDWGQDLKRLAQFVNDRGIKEINVDYWGAGNTDYYLKTKYKKLNSCDAPRKGWVAVSAMYYLTSRINCDYRRWLPMNRLVAKIGYSIFVFRID